MQGLVQAGLTNALAATLLALLAAGAGRTIRRPALTHSLWVLVLLKLVTPPIASVAITLGEPQASANVAKVLEFEPEKLADEPLLSPAQESDLQITPADSIAVEELVEPTQDARAKALLCTPSRIDFAASVPWLLACWFVGALGWWGLAAVRMVRFQRSLRDADSPSVALSEQVQRLAARLSLAKAPRVLLVPGQVPPLIWFIGGAASLVLPSSLWQRLTAEERESLLIHELAHLRRRDHWMRWLELLIGGLYWWHPVVWWARRALREVEEQCCDAWVVWAWPESARSYARALLTTLDFLSEPRSSVPLAASGIGQVSCLKRRLTMIVRAQTPKGLSWPGRLAVFTLAGVLLPLAPTWAQRDGEPKPDEARREAAAVDRRGDDPAPRSRDAAPEGEREVRRARRVETEPADPKRVEEIEKTRKEVHELHEKLQQAEQRLAELEGRPHLRFTRVHSFDVRGRIDATPPERLHAPSTDRLIEPPAARERLDRRTPDNARSLPEAHGRPRPRPPFGPEQEERMRALEGRLDQLVKDLQNLRNEMRGGERITPPNTR